MVIRVFGDLVINNPETIELELKLKRILEESDFNIVNFETPVYCHKANKMQKSGPSLYQSNKTLAWLKDNSFNIVSLANNHIMDYGEEAFEETINRLGGIHHVGAGDWENAYSPLILEQDDVTVAIFSMAELQFGILYEQHDKYMKGGAWINHPSVNNIIKRTKKVVDYVIMIAHAGLEDEDIPLPEWRERYRELIDVGCDVIIGGHTHMVQGCEIFKEKLICYSLGNFVFERNLAKKDSWCIGEFVSLSLSRKGIEYNIFGTRFFNNRVELISDEYWKEKLDLLNKKLGEGYENEINRICIKKMDAYNMLFSMGGYIYPNRYLWKSIIRYFLRRCDNIHVLNNLQCESHRWTIMRALRKKNGL